MSDSSKELGKLIGSHGLSPVFLQRAVFIGVTSLLFFFAMMLVFYLRESLVYFLLATAFLLVYLITMVSWFLQRKTELRIFEKGFSFKKARMRWDEISRVGSDGTIDTTDGGKVVIPASIRDFDVLMNVIRSRAAATSE